MTAETGRSDLVTRKAEELRELVARTRCVLFDFDGPICGLFAGYPAEVIARAQVSWLVKRGLDRLLTDEERASPDPHGVLSAVAGRHPGSDLVLGLEEHLTRHELRAARVAAPTAHADPLIRNWAAAGARLAVVTNNSARTVASYLRNKGLFRFFQPHIYGRTQDLSVLKPHPKSLNLALTALGATPDASLMIGDMPSDFGAARSAGVPFLGYAHHPDNDRRLREAGVPPPAIVTSLEPLLRAVRDG